MDTYSEVKTWQVAANGRSSSLTQPCQHSKKSIGGRGKDNPKIHSALDADYVRTVFNCVVSDVGFLQLDESWYTHPWLTRCR